MNLNDNPSKLVVTIPPALQNPNLIEIPSCKHSQQKNPLSPCLNYLAKIKFIQCKIELNKVKAHKLGSNAIILPCGGRAQQQRKHILANHY